MTLTVRVQPPTKAQIARLAKLLDKSQGEVVDDAFRTDSERADVRTGDGRYTYDGSHERICRICGQPFGWHDAQPPFRAVASDIPNVRGHTSDAEPRDCPGFKPPRRGRRP